MQNCLGCVSLDMSLLKPSRLEFADDPVPMLTMPDAHAPSPQWLEYSYRKAHSALRWLPMKLAEWIGENLQDQLGFPDKIDQSKSSDKQRKETREGSKRDGA